jgi:hypothetical protein
MATVGVMGPFHGHPLGPGESEWIDFGESQGFGNCALSVTASPHDGHGGSNHVLTVDNVNITGIETVQGDISLMAYHGGCNVRNNGQTTITTWGVLVGVIVP